MKLKAKAAVEVKFDFQSFNSLVGNQTYQKNYNLPTNEFIFVE